MKIEPEVKINLLRVNCTSTVFIIGLAVKKCKVVKL